MPRIKLWIGLGVVSALALTLAACSSQTPETAAVSRIAQTPSAAPPTPTAEPATVTVTTNTPSPPTSAPQVPAAEAAPTPPAAPAAVLPADKTASRPPMPEILLPMKKGKPPVKLSSYKGKVVLLDFWATWCGPCRMSIPELEALYKKYHSQGFEVIGISVDDERTRELVPVAQKKLGMTYPIVFASDIEHRPHLDISGIPHFILIDKKGRIGGEHEGYAPNMGLEGEVTQLLKE